MSDDTYCAQDTGWRMGASAPAKFTTEGKFLKADLCTWAKDETITVGAGADCPEELGAVLEGEFELTCGDEHYVLSAGMGIVVPPREAHTWRARSHNAVLYRVFGPKPNG